MQLLNHSATSTLISKSSRLYQELYPAKRTRWSTRVTLVFPEIYTCSLRPLLQPDSGTLFLSDGRRPLLGDRFLIPVGGVGPFPLLYLRRDLGGPPLCRKDCETKIRTLWTKSEGWRSWRSNTLNNTVGIPWLCRSYICTFSWIPYLPGVVYEPGWQKEGREGADFSNCRSLLS